MATQSDLLRHSDLLNQLVIDRATMEEIGRVEVLWMYPPAHKVLGFVCKSGLLGAKKFAFNLGQIHTIGASILVNSGAQPTDGDKVSQLESLVGREVWSDAGVKVGKVIDCLFSLKTGAIADYLIAPDGLAIVTEGVYRLPPSKITSTGRRRVLIAAATAEMLQPFRPGIKQRLSKVGASLKEDYTGVTQELRSLSQKAQSATERARERARLLAEQTRNRADRLKTESQTLAEQARTQGKGWLEQVKDRTQTIGEQLQAQFDQTIEELGQSVPEPETIGSPLDVPLDEWLPDAAPSDLPPLDEDDLLSGDWGIPVPPMPPDAIALSATAVSEVSSAPATQNPTTQNPTTQNPTTQAPTTQNPTDSVATADLTDQSTSLDDDLWDDSPTPTVTDAIASPATAVSEAFSEAAPPASPSPESPPLEEDEPWI